jgi:hypothetical protein
MRQFFVLILFVALPIGVLAQSPAAPSSKDEMITIDGKKHPDMIPEWSVWQFTIDVLAGDVDHAAKVGDREIDSLPTVFYRAIPDDQLPPLIKRLRDAAADQRRCFDDALKARIQLGADKDPLLSTKMADIEMECRRRTLRSRDHILASLSPQGQAVFRQFVEDRKPGMSLVISKSELARYRLPK